MPGLRLFSALVCLATAATAQSATPWREAERIFHGDPQWLGSDGAFSIDLGNGRVLWLFGDTFVARKLGDTRKNAAFVRNTVAIQTGYDPLNASMKFYWRKGSRLEIFPSEGNVWMWPAHGIRVGDKLIVFCSRITANPGQKSLGFRGVGSSIFVIDNPDAEPSAWKMRDAYIETTQIMLGSAILRQRDFIYIYCGAEPSHYIFLAMMRTMDVAAGRFNEMEWWDGEGWSSKAHRKPVMRDVASEISVQSASDRAGGGFVEINSQGFGATDIVMRRAAAGIC